MMKQLQRYLYRLLQLLVVCVFPFLSYAQTELNQSAVSLGASKVTGDNITGYVSVGQIATYMYASGSQIATQGIILNEINDEAEFTFELSGNLTENNLVNAGQFLMFSSAAELNGQPLVNEWVYLILVETEEIFDSTLTQSDGYYEFSNVPYKDFFLTVRTSKIPEEPVILEFEENPVFVKEVEVFGEVGTEGISTNVVVTPQLTTVSDEPEEVVLWYRDADDDGFGDELNAVKLNVNAQQDGYVANSLDCNDAKNWINPEAVQQVEESICEGDSYQFGSQLLTLAGDYTEVFSTENGCDSTVNLTLSLKDCSSVCSTFELSRGWNIVSVNNSPENPDMLNLLQPLIDAGSLVKVQNEAGVSLEDWGIFGGWQNNIGDVAATEGYKIKVNTATSLEICGVATTYPFAIPLKAGWNIMGYPQTTSYNGLDLVQQLIDKNTLVKIQDEKGNSIEDWGIFGGWQNNIGEFVPGDGYKIKVTTKDTLWVEETYTKSSLILPEAMATSHFQVNYSGNGVDHMNLNIVDLPTNKLQVGDELAVFDGDLCVGAITISGDHLQNEIVSLIASARDESGLVGFEEGHGFRIKLWKADSDIEYLLEPKVRTGTGQFVKHETTVLSLEKYADKKFELAFEEQICFVTCFPNPFSHEVMVDLQLPVDSEVEVAVLNQLGQQIKLLQELKMLTNGEHRYSWDGSNESNEKIITGLYYLRVNVNGEVYNKKIVYKK